MQEGGVVLGKHIQFTPMPCVKIKVFFSQEQILVYYDVGDWHASVLSLPQTVYTGNYTGNLVLPSVLTAPCPFFQV